MGEQSINAAPPKRRVSTIKEQREEIAGYISTLIKQPSVFTAWDPERMKYGVFRKRPGLLRADALETRYDDGDIQLSDMHILRALHCLTYAPPEAVARLVKFWTEEDKYEAFKNNRQRLLYPAIFRYRDYYHRLDALSKYGVVKRFDFYPQYPKPNREWDETECIFKVTSYGVQMYKQILHDKEIAYDPREGYSCVHDAFESALSSVTLAPFLRSTYLKKAVFKQTEQIENRRCRYRTLLVFNRNGRSGDDAEDTEVFIEGVAFRTDENAVTLDRRYEYYEEKVKELFKVFMEHQKNHPVFMVFCCEDPAGMRQIINIVEEHASHMLDKCLFTTGRVIQDSAAVDKPSMLRKCFMNFDSDENGKLSYGGAAGFYFLDIDIDADYA